MEDQNIFYQGDVIRVLDRIDGESTITATVKYIEEDDEIEGIFYLYLVANEESLNDKFDEKIGYFWTIIESSSPYITIVSRAC